MWRADEAGSGTGPGPGLGPAIMADEVRDQCSDRIIMPCDNEDFISVSRIYILSVL